MTMLDPAQIDLSELAEALEDHSYEHEWYIDRATGEILLRSYLGDEMEDIEARDLVAVDTMSSDESYQDLVDFATRVRDPRARDLLMRAIEGRGAFRRFKDTLFEFPDLRKDWFAFHDARMARRSIEWLRDEGLMSGTDAERALAELTEPELPEASGAFDPHEIASAVAEELRGVYGGRLKEVLLYGSWARGDAHPESDVDILVVLDRVRSWVEERDLMDDALWKHSLENSTVVSALIVSEADHARQQEPVLIRAVAEGIAFS
jgi:predicted nucleotidyltransferase